MPAPSNFNNGLRLRVSAVLPALAVALGLGTGGLMPASAHAGDLPADCMPLRDVRPGMKGYGLSVFRGIKIERFDVEVLSIIRHFAAKQDVILVRLSGQNLEHSGIVAGMSGSPVYIDGKLVGAVAYGFAFSKDPIGGLQPIEQMLAIPEVAADLQAAAKAKSPDKQPKPPGTRPRPPIPGQAAPVQPGKPPAGASTPTGSAPQEPPPQGFGRSPDPASLEVPLESPLRIGGRTYDYARMAGPDLVAANTPGSPGAGAPGGSWSADTLVLQRLCTPVQVGGMSPRLLSALADELRPWGLVPTAGGAPGAGVIDSAAASARIEPGSAVTVQLVKGDIDMSANGTVTMVLGDKAFLAFGHSMLSEGTSRLPVATGFVHSVIPGVQRSFKLAGPLKPAGRLAADEETGIFGRLGDAPPMLPVHVRVETPGRKDTYRLEVALHPRLTPLLLRNALMAALSARSELPARHTIRYDSVIRFEGRPELRVGNVSSGMGAMPALAAVAVPLAVAMDNPFGALQPTGMDVHLRVEAADTTATMIEARLDRDRVPPGATVTVNVTVRPPGKEPVVLPVRLTVPADMPEGRHELTVSDARGHVIRERSEASHRFEPTDPAGLLAAMGYDEPNTALFARLRLPDAGVVLDRLELPDLPAGKAAMLSDARRTNVRTLAASVVERTDTPYIVMGRARFQLTVDKAADK